jgi:hypothetical protein
VSIPDAAEMLGFSETYFRNNVLPSLPRIPGTRPRILVADLEAWAEDHKHMPELPKTRVFVEAGREVIARRRPPECTREINALARELTARAARTPKRRNS